MCVTQKQDQVYKVTAVVMAHSGVHVRKIFPSTLHNDTNHVGRRVDLSRICLVSRDMRLVSRGRSPCHKIHVQDRSIMTHNPCLTSTPTCIHAICVHDQPIIIRPVRCIFATCGTLYVVCHVYCHVTCATCGTLYCS